MAANLTIVTPVHVRDWDRFLLQRESFESCGIDIPQIAIVNTEDRDSLGEVPWKKGLNIISTSDVLSRQIEMRRKQGLYRRRNPLHWWFRRLGPGIHGWALQQILKLSAVNVIDTPVMVTMDTDTFFVRPTSGAEFFSEDGRPHLYESIDDLDAEMAEWPAHSMRFLGIQPTGRTLRRYTHAPVVISRDVARDMMRHIENLSRRPWDEAMLAAERVMEYTVYGVFAREIDQLSRLTPTTPPLSEYFWWPREVSALETEFEKRIIKSARKIVCIQSNTGCGPEQYRSLAVKAWNMNQIESE